MVIKTETYLRDLTPTTLPKTRAAGDHFVQVLSLPIPGDQRVSASPYLYHVCFIFRVGGEDTPAPLGVEPPAQEHGGVSITRRDWLLQEKQQLQVSRWRIFKK